MRNAAGNFYINDSRPAPSWGSGRSAEAARPARTHKAGSIWNLIRRVSPRAIKETLAPPRDYRYPFLS